MSENKNIGFTSQAETIENEKTQSQKEEADKIRRRMEEDRAKAEQARAEAEAKRLEEEARRQQEAEEAELNRKNVSADVLKAGVGLAAAAVTTAGAARKTGGKIRSFFLGALIGLLVGAFCMFQIMKPKEPMVWGHLEGQETADAVVDDDGFLGYTAADFEDAVLGGISEHQELVVMEQPVSILTTITRAGLGNLNIFSKVKNVTYYGTGVYTVDLSHIDRRHIKVDQDTKTVTIRIPHTYLQYVVPDLEATEFEDTEKGLLAFGDIKMTTEEQNELERSVEEAMRERLDQPDRYEEADTLALLKTYEIFQPLVTAVSREYVVEMVFDD
ncbi:MAG: DUF4230 domain-containing protein [Solobacterium sp.]|nr:DUF4230 domain-containing protein [Solobacterium sp.]